MSKRKAVRLEQTQTLDRLYQEAGMQDDYRARFVKDMVSRLGRDQGLSPRMRRWLDDLIEQGIPEPKGDKELLAKLEAARDLHGMQDDQKILSDFTLKARNGWEFSEKQQAWADRLLEKAKDIRKNGVWVPSEDQLHRLRLCVQLGRAYSGTYWSSHRKTYYAFEAVTSYITCLDSGHDASQRLLNEYKVDIVLKQFKSKLVELIEKPRVLEGNLGFDRRTKEAVLICGKPDVDEYGEIRYPVLVGEEHKLISTKNILKRAPSQ